MLREPASTRRSGSSVPAALGKRARLLRRTRELTQDERAQAAGISRSFVSMIEHGTHGVDVVRLWRLAAVFGVPLTERTEAVMTASNADNVPESTGSRLSLDDLARQQGVRPIKSVAELVGYDVFESDEEVDEFIAFTYAQRRADIA